MGIEGYTNSPYLMLLMYLSIPAKRSVIKFVYIFKLFLLYILIAKYSSTEPHKKTKYTTLKVNKVGPYASAD